MTSQHDRDSRELRELCAQRDAARATVRQQAERIAELEKEALAKPFAPDWAGYRQGLEDGKREGQAERDKLRAEVERLRVDAERYRWLKAYDQNSEDMGICKWVDEGWSGQWVIEHDPDTAIDQARTTHKDEG